MKFTRNNINNQPLLSYLLNNVVPVSHRQENGNLVSVYETETAIYNLEKKIKQHKNDGRYNKHVPLWKKHIEILEGISDASHN